jgi:AcrR family transcriptional regulator
MTTDPGAPLRADARRKRDQIVAAAKTMFARLGPDAPMEEIARAAGVGVGTLYRRFPDRPALICAVAQDNFAAVLAETRTAVAEEPTAWDAFARLIRESSELRLSVQLAVGSRLAGRAVRDDPDTRQFRYELLGMLDTVVRAAQAEGALRADVGTGDVTWLLVLLLARPPATPGEPDWLVAERALALMLASLHTRPGTPLPGRPLTVEDVDAG